MYGGGCGQRKGFVVSSIVVRLIFSMHNTLDEITDRPIMNPQGIL